jgi:putative tryptophan/tyrosine transport system substrate-binding protein
VLSKT